jgi:hypothetical protein
MVYEISKLLDWDLFDTTIGLDFEDSFNENKIMKLVMINTLLLLGLCISCAPIPVKKTISPLVQGILKSNKKLAVNYTIKLQTRGFNACDSPDKNSILTTYTDSKGNFSFPEKNKWALFRTLLITHSVVNYNICIIAPNGEKRWTYNYAYTIPEYLPNLKFSCDFSRMEKKPHKKAKAKANKIDFKKSSPECLSNK